MASTEDMRREVAEASARPGVVRRWEAIADGHTTTTDKTGKACRLFAGDHGCPVLESLLPMERERIELVLWQDSPGVDVIDVSQNPEKRARTVKRGEDTFMTVIAGCGYFVRTDLMRQDIHTTTFVTASDVLSMSGFPITSEQVHHAGVPCMFSRSHGAPACRSPKSMKKQCGNAMHFTHVGLVFFIALLKFPALGAAAVPLPSAVTTLSSSSSRQKRKRDDDTSESAGASAAPTTSSLLAAVRARRNRSQLPNRV